MTDTDVATDVATIIDTTLPPMFQSYQQMAEVEVDPDPDSEPPLCGKAHRWLIEPTDSSLVQVVRNVYSGEVERWLPAVCKVCNATRLFPATNYIDSTFSWNDRMMIVDSVTGITTTVEREVRTRTRYISQSPVDQEEDA